MDDYFDHVRLVCLLEAAGFCDAASFPEIHAAVDLYRRFGDPSELAMVVDQGLIHHAQQIIELNPFCPVPGRVDAQRLCGPIDVGVINGYGDRLGFNLKDFCLGWTVFGAPGTGKSYMICGVADQVLRIPPSQRGFTVLFVQWSKSDAHSFAVKYPWVKYLDLPDLPYNLWQPMPGEDPRDRLRHSVNTFAFENYLGSLSLPVLAFALEKSYRVLGTFEGRDRYPCFSDVLRAAPEFKVPGYEMSSVLGKLLTRLEHFSRYPWLNLRRGLTADFFLRNDCVLDVSGTDEHVARTIIMGVLGDIHRHFMRNPPSSDLAFLVVIDEARSLFDVTRERQDFDANRNEERWVTESRSAAQGRIVGTQEPSSLPSFVTSNSHFLSLFRLGGEELSLGGKALSLSDGQLDALFRFAPFGECVFRHPLYPGPFVLAVRQESGLLPGVSSLNAKAFMRPFVDHLHDFARKMNLDRAVVGGRMPAPAPGGLLPDELKVLEELRKNPFLMKSKLFVCVGGKTSFETAARGLLEKGFVVEVQSSGKSGPKPTYYPLTVKAQELLRLPVSRRIDPSRFEHSLFIFRVRSWLAVHGDDAVTEYSVSGVPGRIDVYSKTSNSAFEIQFSSKNAVENAEKCLERFGCAKVLFVCRSRADASDLETKFWVSSGPLRIESWRGKVSFVEIQKYL